MVFAESAYLNVVRRAVRGSRYKLIYTEDTGRNAFGIPVQSGYEFYDLLQDPGEQTNLYDQGLPVIKHLEGQLDAFVQSSYLAAQGAPQGESPELAPEDIELLRSLGYVK